MPAAVLGVLGTGADARAFYFKGWPGAKLTPERTVISPKDQGKPGNPPPSNPFPPPGGEHPPGEPGGPDAPGNNQPPPGPGPGPGSVPEPATGAIGLIGLAALGAARRFRRKR